MCKCLCTKRSDQLQFKKILSGQREAVVFDKFDEDRDAVVAAGLVTRWRALGGESVDTDVASSV